MNIFRKFLLRNFELPYKIGIEKNNSSIKWVKMIFAASEHEAKVVAMEIIERAEAELERYEARDRNREFRCRALPGFVEGCEVLLHCPDGSILAAVGNRWESATAD